MIQRSMKAFASFFFLYTVVLCIHLWLPVTASSMLQQNETELALIAFKAGITQDPLGMLSSWNDTPLLPVVECVLQSPTCQPSHQINLFSYGLVGSLSPHIRNLTFLRTTVLQNNSFHGKVPFESFIPLASSFS